MFDHFFSIRVSIITKAIAKIDVKLDLRTIIELIAKTEM